MTSKSVTPGSYLGSMVTQERVSEMLEGFDWSDRDYWPISALAEAIGEGVERHNFLIDLFSAGGWVQSTQASWAISHSTAALSDSAKSAVFSSGSTDIP